MLQSRALLFGVLVLAGLVVAPSISAAQAIVSIQRAGRLEFYVPPGGGEVEIPVHPWELCVLSFSEEMSKEILISVTDFVLEEWSKDHRQIGMRAKVNPTGSGQTGTFALMSKNNKLKVSVTFRVVPKEQPINRFAYFQTATLDELVDASVQDRVEKIRKNLEPEILKRAEQILVDRSLIRLEKIDFHGVKERNNDNVVALLQEALLFGDVGYLFFTLRNRGTTPFRVSRLELTRAGAPLLVEVKLLSTAVDKDPDTIGVVLPEKTVRGVVILPNVTPHLKIPLSLELAGFQGQGAFSIPEIVLQ